MIGLDTNVLFRWLLDGSIAPDDSPDQRHLVSELVLESDERFFVNHVVIAETVWLLKNKVDQSNETVKEIVDCLLGSFNVEIDRPSTVEAALASFVRHPGGFADHLIGKINRDAGCRTTMTFDRAASRSPDFTPLKSQG